MYNSPKDLRKKILGRKGEDLTAKYLKKRGYKLLERNFRTPFGEADIVALSPDGYTCFVEVKTRETDGFGAPSEAVTESKRQRYRKMAGYWCLGLGRETAVRFDVASVYKGEIEYFENAFV